MVFSEFFLMILCKIGLICIFSNFLKNEQNVLCFSKTYNRCHTFPILKCNNCSNSISFGGKAWLYWLDMYVLSHVLFIITPDMLDDWQNSESRYLKDDLDQIWFKMGQWFQRRNFLKRFTTLDE